MKQQEFGWQTKSGLQIYAKKWMPDGETRAVVALVHGLGEHVNRYQHVAEQFTAAGIAMVGFDLPGHGRSGGIRGHASFASIGDEIDHLLKEIRTQYPGKPCFLYGHSLGGASVLYYTLKRRPDLAGTIVTSPGLGVSVPVPAWKSLLAKTMARIYPSLTMANGLDLNNLSHDPVIIQAYRSDPLVHDRVSASLGWDILTQGAGIIEKAGQYPVPLLLMQGSEDHLVSPSATNDFAKHVPSGLLTYKVWDGLYHETHNEVEKQQVIQTMLDWLNMHI